MVFTRCLGDNDAMRGHAYYVPVTWHTALQPVKSDLFGVMESVEASSTGSANLAVSAVAYLSALGLPNPDTDRDTAELIWMHALAIGYSPAYLSDNADGIRENWPRIPLPASREALLASAALGREVAALLDTEAPVPGVTSGTIRDELKSIAVVSRAGGGTLKPDEFALTQVGAAAAKAASPCRAKAKPNPALPGCTNKAQVLAPAPPWTFTSMPRLIGKIFLSACTTSLSVVIRSSRSG